MNYSTDDRMGHGVVGAKPTRHADNTHKYAMNSYCRFTNSHKFNAKQTERPYVEYVMPVDLRWPRKSVHQTYVVSLKHLTALEVSLKRLPSEIS